MVRETLRSSKCYVSNHREALRAPKTQIRTRRNQLEPNLLSSKDMDLMKTKHLRKVLISTVCKTVRRRDLVTDI